MSIFMANWLRRMIAIWILSSTAGCASAGVPSVTPTALTERPATLVAEATATSVSMATLTPTSASSVSSPTPDLPLQPPLETPVPSVTPGPYEHTIQAGETLGYIIQIYGYRDLSVGSGGIIDQVVSLNVNVLNADVLPPPGSVILIPRQTATPNSPEEEATPASNSTTQTALVPTTSGENRDTTQYVVQANDTIIGVAQDYNVTLGQIAVLNPDLDFFSCNFEIPSGGPSCIVPLVVGQSINLPAPTPTPTLSPTPSGKETATNTPTLMAPLLIFPPDGAIAPSSTFNLQWVGAGILRPGEFYLVEITDSASGQKTRAISRDNSYSLPESLIPTDGQQHQMQWTVRIVRHNQQGAYDLIGGEGEVRVFQWQSK